MAEAIKNIFVKITENLQFDRGLFDVSAHDEHYTDNPVRLRREKIMEWVTGACANVEITDDIRADARELMARGLKNADALHLACAAAVDSDWFLTVDKGILKKVDAFKATSVANPVDFILEYDHEDD